MRQVENDSRYNAYGNFLDFFYYSMSNEERAAAIAKPPIGEERHPIDAAKLAATVERLCHLYDLDVPEWVMDDKYILPEPYFGEPYPRIEEYRTILAQESLPEFVKRNLFLGDNCMSRA